MPSSLRILCFYLLKLAILFQTHELIWSLQWFSEVEKEGTVSFSVVSSSPKHRVRRKSNNKCVRLRTGPSTERMFHPCWFSFLLFTQGSFYRWENRDWREGNDCPTFTQLIRQNCPGHPGQTTAFPAHPLPMPSAFPGSSHVLMWLSSWVLRNPIFFSLFRGLISAPLPTLSSWEMN